MSYIVLAFMVVAALAVIVQAQRQHGASRVTPVLELIGGVLLAGLAVTMALTGRVFFAIPIAALALAVFLRSGSFGGRRRASPGDRNRSDVRTGWLTMSLDHDTGDMDGQVLRGRFEGYTLSQLSADDMLQLRIEVEDDAQSVQLVDAFLDRTFPDWREAHGNGANGSAGEPMTRDKALEVLGLDPDASEEDIRRAHRELMKKLHPDHGGSTALAMQVNAAKDFLLG